jgi:cyclohexadieny/prephenate dehydrogenase
MATFTCQSVALLGLGLISGSLARALKSSHWNGELIGWGPREPSLALGLELGVIDRYSLDLDEVLSTADMVVVGAPPKATGNLLADVVTRCARLERSPVVTDMASIKGFVIDGPQQDYERFVPAHPIAGSEHSGVQASDASLFSGREIILTPLATTDTDATEQVEAMWRLTGAYLRRMEVEQHDAVLASSSHMPHMVAYALTAALAEDPTNPTIHGGGALRDMTRIAGSDPTMWGDIAETNRAALLTSIDQFAEQMAKLRDLIETRDDEALKAYFLTCREHRRTHDDILNPVKVDGVDTD